MKTETWDYMASSLVLATIAVLGLAGAALVSHMLTSRYLGGYHVLADAALFLLFFGVLAALACRLILRGGQLRPGEYAMEDPVFRWWKLFTVVYEFGRGALLPFTTVFARPLVARLFGAAVGKDVALGGILVDPQFISIGDEAIIGQDAVITAHTITSGVIILDPVVIGARATVGVKVVVMSGVTIGEGAVLTAAAVVPPGTTIPAAEMWGGVPARKIKDVG
ncbi:MAG TPA: hypothetical protein ENJ19_07910 [Gammaproteobacteria bacterium]|nr:hypothetical protein [Gammaproteobacteria bacterium]